MSGKEKIMVAYRRLPVEERANGAYIHGGAKLIGYADGSLSVDYLGKEEVINDPEYIQQILVSWLLTPDLRDNDRQREYGESFGAEYDDFGNLVKQPEFYQ